VASPGKGAGIIAPGPLRVHLGPADALAASPCLDAAGCAATKSARYTSRPRQNRLPESDREC